MHSLQKKNKKKCSEKQLKQIKGGHSVADHGKPVSDIARCVFSLFKKC
ncbi:TPA: EntF family bacteriocin induction factor [Enterococcus faecalis]|nr:EntF family bacteriocin induction factor [Enterococcus faecalis]